MKTSTVRGKTLLTILLFTLPPLLAAGCSGRSGTRNTGHTYTVRALVEELPGPTNGLNLTHEAIDDWRGRSGEVTGMSTMTMPFPLADGVSLAGIERGDVVEIQLHVDWEQDLAVQITALRELPRGTRLDFREANPKH
jgi:Cu/Ag efflux protein CusF